jgi:hypothetical protein
VLVPEWREEKRVCTVYTSQPREIEREVVCCKWVPTQVTDCCGCPYTVCKPVQEVQKVKCTIYECVASQKEYMAKVCYCKPVEKTYECRHIVCDCVPEKVKRKVSYCTMEAYQTTVKVAVPCCQTACCN